MIALDFGALSPEINSTLMYQGPGVGPMLSAATSWDRLASELFSAATGCDSVVEDLLSSDSWSGPSATKFSQAITPYVAWLRTTGACAEQTAAQIRQAASAYEIAHQAIIPPELVAANRAQLLHLIATNTFGQNTPAIEATWAQYYEMWAHDAAVMNGYATAASPTTELTRFSPPPTVAKPQRDLAQGLPQLGSATSTVANTAATQPGMLAPLSGAVPASLSNAASAGVKGFQNLTGISNLEGLANYAIMPPRLSNYIMGITNGAHGIATRLAAAAAKATSAATSAATSTSSAASAAASALPDAATLASFGQSATVGTLSVPMSWAAANPIQGISGSTLASSLSSALGQLGTSSSSSVNVSGLLNSVPPLVGTTTRTMANSGPMTLPRVELASHVIPVSPAAG